MTITELEARLEALGQSEAQGTLEAKWRLLESRLSTCCSEIFADLFAARLGGIAFFFAQSNLLNAVAMWPEEIVTPRGYPGTKFRLKLIFEELHRSAGDHIAETLKEARTSGGDRARYASWLSDYLLQWRARLETPERETTELSHPPMAQSDRDIDSICDNIAAERASRVAPILSAILDKHFPKERARSFSPAVFDRVELLRLGVVPFLAGDTAEGAFAEILTAGWIYQSLFGDPAESETTPLKARELYAGLCRRIYKAIELSTLDIQMTPDLSSEFVAERDDARGTLSASSLRLRLSAACEPTQRLHVIPSFPAMIQAASLDLHLGCWFKIFRRARLHSLSFGGDRSALEHQLALSQERVFVPPGHNLIMHPGDLVLGATTEFIAVPRDLSGVVEGKSQLGRAGLFVATASHVAPGFRGCIVLEIVNAGQIPIELRPNMPICQLVLSALDRPLVEGDEYSGSSQDQIGP